MKNIFKLVAAGLILPLSIPVSAQTRTMNLQGTTYTVDTIEHYVAGPAMKYSRLAVRSEGNTFAASVLEFDMKAENRPQIKVEVGRDSVKTAETVTSMATRKSDSSKRYVAGMNGDFFITSSFASNHVLGNQILGFPNVTSATGGVLISPDAIDYSSREKCFIMTKSGEMYIDATDLSGTFSFPGKKSDMKLYHTNYPRTDGDIILYNSYYGGWTKTDNTGWEVAVELLPGESWGLNRPVRTRVVSAPVQKGNSKIPANGAVISAGKSRTSQIEYIKKYNVGDEVILNLNVSLPKHDNLKPENISEILGGDVRILNQGNITKVGDPDAIRFINTATSRYIRSLIGFSKERDKLVFCTVDQGIGNGGVTYYDAGDLMRELGCYDALDLDGGGSTLMYLRTPGIVNHLRDGSERAVGNAVFAVVNAPEDNVVSKIRFADHAVNMPQYSEYVPVIYGYNSNDELISMNVEGVTFSADEALGEIDGNRILLNGTGCHALTATYNGSTATVAVNISQADNISARYKDVTIDNFRQWEAEVVTEVGGKQNPISATALTWISTDPSVASITVDGKVKGIADGQTVLRGTLGDIVVEINLTVETPKGKLVGVETLSKGSDFKLATSGIATGYAVSDIEGGFKVDYRVSSTRNPKITLTPVAPATLYSLPDAFSFACESPLAFKVIMNFKTRAGKTVSKQINNVASGNSEVKAEFSEIADVDDIAATYNLSLRDIVIYPLSSKTATDYSLILKNFTLHYDKYDPAGVEGVIADEENGTGTVEYFDITGRRTENPAPGNFYIRRQGNKVEKIIL